jgi:hypothetical protein
MTQAKRGTQFGVRDREGYDGYGLHAWPDHITAPWRESCDPAKSGPGAPFHFPLKSLAMCELDHTASTRKWGSLSETQKSGPGRSRHGRTV